MKYKNSNAFTNDESQLPTTEEVFKQAEETLVKRIQNYRHIYGKSAIDQRNIIDEEYRHLVFYIYPSEVLQDIEDIIRAHKNLKFEDLEKFVTEDTEYSDDLPFKPLDYSGKQPSSAEEVKQEETAPDKEESEEDWLEEDCLPGMGFIDEDEVEQIEEILPIIQPSKEIMKLVGEAIKDFEMIKEGDGILVALSGGKDSLSLLNILRYLQKKAPVRFKLGAVTIDPKTVEYDPSPLKGYLKKLGVPYFYEEDNLIERAAKSMQNNSIWSFWSRMKRGMIYNWARREGYNVIAMGQHLDDLAESFVMSAFNNGTLRTMKAQYTIDSKDLRVIRPLVYCREKIFKSFSESCNLPVITENCPACFSEPKERHRIKLLLAQQEHEIPTIFSSLLNCMRPLMSMNLKDLINLKDKLSKEDKSKEPEPNFCT